MNSGHKMSGIKGENEMFIGVQYAELDPTQLDSLSWEPDPTRPRTMYKVIIHCTSLKLQLYKNTCFS